MPSIRSLQKKSLFVSAEALASVVRMPEQWPTGPHRHDFVEIAVVLSGRGMHCTGAIRHEICRGDVLVLSGGRSHAYEDTEALNLINILIHPKVLSDMEQELGSLPGFHQLFTFEFARWERKQFRSRLRLREIDLQTAIHWIDALESEANLSSNASPVMIRSWLCLLIGTLARHYESAPAASEHRFGLDRKLGRILSRIDSEPNLDVVRASLAKEAGVSERTLLRCFQRAVGCSPREYITRLRIRRAKALLLDDAQSLNITEIAFLVGYNDSNYFSRQFRLVTGKSPKRFRKERIGV